MKIMRACIVKNFLRSFLCLFLVFGVCTVFSSSTLAQTVVDAMKKPMPDIPMMPEEDFKKSSTLYKQVPFGDEKLAYSVRLPKKWTKNENKALSNFSVSNKVLGEIERFYGPARMGERSYFSVQTVGLEYKLTAEQWLILYMLENGFTLEGLKTIDDKRVEVVYVLIDRNITYVASAVAQISGSLVFFAQYIVPAANWAEESPVSRRILESFELEIIDESFVESMSPYQFLDVAEVKYPDSWELRTKPLRSADIMSVSLLNVKRKNEFSQVRLLRGKMEVHLLSDYIVEDIDSHIKEFIEGVNNGKLIIQDSIEEYEDFTVDENVEVIEVKAYNAVDKSQAVSGYEYWLAVLVSGEYYYFLSLLTPSRDADYFDWARNTQTFRVLVQNTKPLI